MTSAAVEKPDLDRVPGIIGGSRVGHVKNLLSRSLFAAANIGLTPEVIRRMRRHYQVTSCLTVQSLPIMRADWSIECDDERIQEGLTAAYRRIAFAVHRSAARSLWAGYSPNGLEWDYFADLRLIAPSAVRDLDPFTCKPITDDRGDLDGFEQRIGGVPETIEPIYALWIVEGMEAGNWLGRSILESALDPWQDYAAFRAFHARYLERFGEPIVLCRAPAGKSVSNTAEIEQIVANNAAAGLNPGDTGYVMPPAPQLVDNLDTAQALGQGLRHHSVVALPADLLFGADGKPTGFAWGLEFVESKGGKGQDFLDAIRETDQRIARAMFVPDLLLNNTSEVGSNALGQSHRSTWSESVEGRLDDYSRQITEQILDPIRVLNYGANSASARLVFQPLADEAIERWWKLAETLATGGRLPVDVEELGQKLGIPLLDAAAQAAEAAAEADALRRVETALDAALAARGVTARSTAPEPVQLDHGHEPAPRWLDTLALDPVAGLPEWRIPQDYDPPPFRRALNTREVRVGFQRIEAGLNASEAATIAQLDELLAAEHDRILRQLTGILKRGTTAEILKALGELQLGVGPKVTRAWSDLMAVVAAETLAGLRSELAAYADDLPDSLGTEGRALFSSYATTSADSALSKLLTEVRSNLLNGYTSGVSRAGLAAIVGQVFDAYSTSEAKPVRLTTRMLTSKSLNYTRAAAVERGGIPLAGAQYSAVLDRRTCDLCASMDEQIIPIEHGDLARFTPPVHHNCRCLWVWITRDEADFTPTWKTPSPSLVDRFGGLVF